MPIFSDQIAKKVDNSILASKQSQDFCGLEKTLYIF